MRYGTSILPKNTSFFLCGENVQILTVPSMSKIFDLVHFLYGNNSRRLPLTAPFVLLSDVGKIVQLGHLVKTR